MKFINLYNIIIESRLDDYKLQLKDQQLANNIFSLNDPKKQRMIIKWIKNGSIKYPDDIQIIDKAYQIINRKNLDYNKFNSPQQILNQFNQLNQKIDYNPDNEPCFTNKVQLGNGVVVYNVQDSYQGLKAVRRAVDFNWGEDANPWCLITRPMENALTYWKKYSYIPKRICFQNKKLIAFCANNDFVIQWWDRNDKPHKNIPIEGVEDDPNAIKKLQQIKEDIANVKTLDTKKLIQIYNRYKHFNGILKNIALNPNCPNDLLKELSEHKEFYIKINVALNPNCPDDLLKQLLNYSDIKQEILFSKEDKISLKILIFLANDENANIRDKVARNDNLTDIKTIQKLFNDPDKFVRYGLVYNKNTPQDIKNTLFKEIENDNKYIQNWYRELIIYTDCNPNIIKTIYKLNKSNFKKAPLTFYEIEEFIAKNPNTPIEILMDLKDAFELGTQKAAIKNLNKRGYKDIRIF